MRAVFRHARFDFREPGFALTGKKLVENGETREVARDKLERNRDYFDLVTGECTFHRGGDFLLPAVVQDNPAGSAYTASRRVNDAIDT